MATFNNIPKFGDYDSEDVRKLQIRLKELGFDPKGIDGDFGKNTLDALSNFQKSKGLPGKGIIGTLSLDFLDIKLITYGLSFLKNIEIDKKLSTEDSKKFYKSICQLCSNEMEFNECRRKTIAEINTIENIELRQKFLNAPCATTTATVLEKSFKDAGLMNISKLFEKCTSFGPTHFVEVILYRLGFKYWLKSNYHSQIGAIGLLSGRYTWYEQPDHSGHIYTIISEHNEYCDVIGDNVGYNRVYKINNQMQKTGGFWLPNGIEPKKREL